MYRITLNVVAVLLIASIGTASQAELVDSFDNGEFMSNFDMGGPSVHVSGTLPGVIGGIRQVTTTMVTGAQISTAIDVDDSNVSAMSSNFGSVGTWEYLWDAGGAGLGADLSADAFLRVVFLDSDAGSTLELEFVDGGGNSATANGVTTEGPDTVNFAFSAFAGVDMADIDSIKLTVFGIANGDYAIDEIFTEGDPQVAVMPSPSPVIGGLLLLGFVAYTRRHHAAVQSYAAAAIPVNNVGFRR